MCVCIYIPDVYSPKTASFFFTPQLQNWKALDLDIDILFGEAEGIPSGIGRRMEHHVTPWRLGAILSGSDSQRLNKKMKNMEKRKPLPFNGKPTVSF